MLKTLKISLTILAICILGFVATVTIAQEDTTVETESEIQELIDADENITAENLEIDEPTILPDNPFYFFKSAIRGVKSAFTFNPVKKAELKLEFANEKLIEIKKLAEKTDNQTILDKALNKYGKEIEKIDKIVEKAKDRIGDNPHTDKFINKFIDNQIKHQKLLGKIEGEVSEEVFEEIRIAKEKAINSLANVPLLVKTPADAQKMIMDIMENQTGSDFKHFKNLEVLKELENKVPEVAREAIQRARENTFNRIENKMEEMNTEQRDQLSSYIEKMGGNEIRHMEIIHEFESRKIPEEIRMEMEEAKEKSIERIGKRIEALSTEERKGEFLKHLEKGKIEDIRIIKELENNLSLNTVNEVIKIKNRAFNNFREDMKNADTPEEQEEFFDKMEKFHDIKQFEIFNEMDEIIPEDKKEFWGGMKERAATEMKKDFDAVHTSGERKIILERLAGDSPKHVDALKDFQEMDAMKKFGPPQWIMQEMMKEQVSNISDRIENIENEDRLKMLKKHIEENDNIRGEMQLHNPAILQSFEKREDFLSNTMLREIKKDRIENKNEPRELKDEPLPIKHDLGEQGGARDEIKPNLIEPLRETLVPIQESADRLKRLEELKKLEDLNNR